MAKDKQRVKKKTVKFPTRVPPRPQLANNQSLSKSLRKERDESHSLRQAFEQIKGNNFQLASTIQYEKIRNSGLLQETTDLKKKNLELQSELNKLKSKVRDRSLSKDSVKDALDRMLAQVQGSYVKLQKNFIVTQQAMEATASSFSGFAEDIGKARDSFWQVAADHRSPDSSFRPRRSSGAKGTPRQRVLPSVRGMQIHTKPSIRIPRLYEVAATENVAERESSSDSNDESLQDVPAIARQRRRTSGIFQPRRPTPVSAASPRRATHIVSSSPRVSLVPESGESSENPSDTSTSSIEVPEVRVMVKRLSQEEIAKHSPAHSDELQSPVVGVRKKRMRGKFQNIPAPPRFSQESNQTTELEISEEEDKEVIPEIVRVATPPIRPGSESILNRTFSFKEEDEISLASGRPSSSRSDRSVSDTIVEQELEEVFRESRCSSPEAPPSNPLNPGRSVPLGTSPSEAIGKELDLTESDETDQGVKRNSDQADLVGLDNLWGDYVMKPKKLSCNDPLEGTSKKFKVKTSVLPRIMSSAGALAGLTVASYKNGVDVLDAAVDLGADARVVSGGRMRKRKGTTVIRQSDAAVFPLGDTFETSSATFVQPLAVGSSESTRPASRTSVRVRNRRETAHPESDPDRVLNGAVAFCKKDGRSSADATVFEGRKTRNPARKSNTPVQGDPDPPAVRRERAAPKRYDGFETGPRGSNKHLENGETLVGDNSLSDAIGDGEKLKEEDVEKKRSSSDKENEVKNSNIGGKGGPRGRKGAVSHSMDGSEQNLSLCSSAGKSGLGNDESLEASLDSVHPLSGLGDGLGLTVRAASCIGDEVIGSPNLYDRLKKRRTSSDTQAVSNLILSISTLSQSESNSSEEGLSRRRAASAMSFKEPSLKVKLRAPTKKKV